MSIIKIIPSIAAIFFGLTIITYTLTVGNWDFNRQFLLSDVFLNMWEHFRNGNLYVDANIIGNEGFLINGKTTAYFLPFPALVRGTLSFFNGGKSAVLSMLIASAMYLTASWLIFKKLLELRSISDPITKYFSKLFFTLLICSPPILGLMTYPDVFTEAITWGYSIFLLCIYFSIAALSGKDEELNLTILSVLVGLSLFTRPPYLVASSTLLILTLAIFRSSNPDDRSNRFISKNLIFPIIIFSASLILLGYFNYLKWGHPFEFYPLEYYLMYSKEDYENLLQIGTTKINRIPESFSYYFLPWVDNFSQAIPWLKTGNHHFFEGLGSPVNYREPTYPITITMPWYVISGVLGIWSLLSLLKFPTRVNKQLVLAIIPSAVATFAPIAAILSLHANAWRYAGEFIPAITIFSMLGWLHLLRKLDDHLLKRSNSSRNNDLIIYVAGTSLFILIFISTLYFASAAVLRKNVFLSLWDINSAYVSQSSPIKPKHPIVFNQSLEHRYGMPFLIHGWSEPEKTYTWSEGDRSVLRFPIPSVYKLSTLNLYVNTLISESHPVQRINIYINGKFFNRKLINTPTDAIEISMPTNLNQTLSGIEKVTNTPIKPNILEIELRYLDATTPKEIGIGNDNRKLAIALKAAIFN